MQLIRAVVFDFDGTLLDTESVWYDSFREVLADHAIDLPLEVFAQSIGTYDDSMFRYILQQTGSDEKVELIKAIAVERHHQKTVSLQLRDGVTDYLNEARRLGLSIGLATSSPRSWVEPFFSVYGLTDYFDAVCTQDDVEHIKPHPELYALAVKRLGVAPEEAVAFEDSAHGARSAAAAGLRCVIVPNPLTEHLAFERYDLRIASMTDMPLAELLAKIESR